MEGVVSLYQDNLPCPLRSNITSSQFGQGHWGKTRWVIYLEQNKKISHTIIIRIVMVISSSGYKFRKVENFIISSHVGIGTKYHYIGVKTYGSIMGLFISKCVSVYPVWWHESYDSKKTTFLFLLCYVFCIFCSIPYCWVPYGLYKI